MHHLRRIAAAPLILCLLVTAACTDNDLRKIENALHDVSLANSVLIDTTTEAFNQGLIDKDPAKAISAGSRKINDANIEATKLARSISKLDDKSKASILAILTPVITSVESMTNSGLLGIKNEATKQKVQGALVAIRTGLTAVQIVVTVSGGK